MHEKHVMGRGLTPVFSTPEAFAKRIAAESAGMEKLIKLTGIKGEQ